MGDGILLVDDQPEVLEHLKRILGTKGYNVLTARRGEDGLRLLMENEDAISLVILDLDLGAGSDGGLAILEKMKRRCPDVPVMILTGKGTTRAAVRAMKLGAADFLEKDLYIAEHLEARVDRVRRFLALVEENRRLRRESERLKRTASYYNELARSRYQLIGSSQLMVELSNKIEALASIPRPVLIRGERGTGKELVAAQIHYLGERASHPFVVVNCAAVAEHLLESELFGHEKGAFTGAESRRIGRFEMADGGTLFLDEIGNMSVAFQEKVLRVIEYQRFERVRGTETIHVNVRVVAATNADIEDMMAHGRFREDLYDRLTFQTIHTPPLRAHPQDVPELAGHFLLCFKGEVPNIRPTGFSEDALDKLARHDWPGNVRELKNVVESAAAVTEEDVIDADHIDLHHRRGRHPDGTFFEQVRAMEDRLIVEAMERADRSQKRAAELLGLTYDQFRHYYRKHRDTHRKTNEPKNSQPES